LIVYTNILVIQTAFIGDAILASSLLEKLHAYNPAAKISILVRKGNEPVYEGHPFLAQVLTWNKKEKKIRNLFKVLSVIRKNKYDCVINCHRYASSGLLTALSGAAHTAGYKENPFSFTFNLTVRHSLNTGLHEIERYNQLVEDFSGPGIFHPKLYPTADDINEIRKLTSTRYVCMAPASVWFTKQLPVEKWIELCDQTGSNTQIFLLGAPGDEALCEKIRQRTKNTSVNILAGKLTLLQSARLMQHALMNFVNDSAPLHLASAVNAPVTAFFCSTVPDFGFGPLSDNSTVRQVEGLDCKPCGIRGFKACPLGHFKCGHEMKVNNLIPETT
jgi:heptosyltransferase-2